MNVTELLREICDRAGEGYREYTDRALAYAKSAIIALARKTRDIEKDAPVLITKQTIGVNDNNHMVIPLDKVSEALGGDIIYILSIYYMTHGKQPSVEVGGIDDYILYKQQPAHEGAVYIIHELHKEPGVSPEVNIHKDKGGDSVSTTIKILLEHYDYATPFNSNEEIADLVNNSAAQLYVTAKVFGVENKLAVLTPTRLKLEGGVPVEIYKAEQISQIEHEMFLIRPDLLRRHGNYNFYTISDNKLWLIKEPARGSHAEFTACIWKDKFLQPEYGETETENPQDISDVNKMFSAPFIEAVITMAAEMLAVEIQR